MYWQNKLLMNCLLANMSLFCSAAFANDVERIEVLIEEEKSVREAGIVVEGGTRLRRSSAPEAPAQQITEMDAETLTVSSELSYDQLAEYQGQVIVVRLKSGQRYQGTVEKIENTKLEITIRQHGGTARVPIAREKIVRIDRG